MGKTLMTKIRWHKRSENLENQDITQQEDSTFSLEKDRHYQSFAHNNVHLFIIDSALDSLTSHLSQDTTKETGGILVGNVYFNTQKDLYFTEIKGAIAPPTTIRNRSTFRFTPDCWATILKKKKEIYPQTKIVGWYHSHPNFGVFLSGVDLETQQDCFNQPWHIAVVYDPIRNDIGFFCGSKGEKMIASGDFSDAKKCQTESETSSDRDNNQELTDNTPQETQNLSQPTEPQNVSSVSPVTPGCLSIFRHIFKFFFLHKKN